MSEVAVDGGRAAWRGRLGTEATTAGAGFDGRRALQLGLAAIWLLDGVLQYQPLMYTTVFARSLADTAAGNPSVIARPITWDATLVAHHLVLLNTVFATIQLLLGLGIAFRRTARAALAASVAWSLGVWWFGEGLGGVLNGTADPVSGAPGGVILYALLAVLLWPADRPGRPAPFVAARAVGTQLARALWVVLWLSLAYFALLSANRAPQALNGMIAGMEFAEPAWLSAIERGAASLVAHQGLAASIALAVAFVPRRHRRIPARPGGYDGAASRHRGKPSHLGYRRGTRHDPRLRFDRPQLRAAARPARPGLLADQNDHANRADHGREPGLMTPSWILDLLAAVMLTVAAVSAARLAAAWSSRRGWDAAGADVAHLLTAIAMAGMLAPGLRTFPDAVWEVIFGILIARFAFLVVWDARVSGVRALAGDHCAPHLVHSGSMLYMFAATTSTGAMAGMSMPGMNEMPGSSGSTMVTLNYPTLALAFALTLIGYSVWDLDQLSGTRSSRAAARVPRAGVGPARIPAMASAESMIVLPARPLTTGPAPGSGAGHDLAAASTESGSSMASSPAGELLLSPVVTVGSRIAMGVVMAFLLIIAI